MKKSLFLIGLLAALCIANSCTKECDCDSNTTTEGSITAHLLGLSCDSVPVDVTFTADMYSTLSPAQGGTLYMVDGRRVITFGRYEDEVEGGKYIGLSIYVDGNYNALDASVSIQYFIEIDDNTTAWLSLGSDSQTTEITNMVFNEETHQLTGNYSGESGCWISDDIVRTIYFTGEFDVHITEILDK